MLSNALLFFAIFSTLSYLFIMFRYRLSWDKMPEFKLQKNRVPSTKITVLVAARNESENIENCLRSIATQEYPEALFEIILIDDHSEDDTIEKAASLKISNLRILKLSEHLSPEAKIKSYKKKAIEIGIASAKGELIVCSDADCFVAKTWLSCIAEVYESRAAKFIAGPVVFEGGKSLFERFQTLDFMGMMLITAAGISGKYLYMCNGANLAYPKAVFEALGGFEGIDGLASGDDMLLLQKIAAIYPNDIHFLKTREALVQTAPQPNLATFLAQRIRWASKSGAYKQQGTQWQLALVWLFMLSIFLSALMAFWDKNFLFVLIAQFALKALADYLLLRKACIFFGQQKLLNIFFPALLLHWLYILSVGFWANLKLGYKWKGRKLG